MNLRTQHVGAPEPSLSMSLYSVRHCSSIPVGVPANAFACLLASLHFSLQSRDSNMIRLNHRKKSRFEGYMTR